MRNSKPWIVLAAAVSLVAILWGASNNTPSLIPLVAGSVTNAMLANSSSTVNQQTCTLGASCSTTMYAQTASVTNAGSSGMFVTMVNTSGAAGTPTIPAGFFGTAGNVLHFYASGQWASNNTGNALIWQILLGGTVVAKGQQNTNIGATVSVWSVNCYIVSRSPGASGTLMSNCVVTTNVGGSGFQGAGAFGMADQGNTFNTTGTLVFDFQTQWGTFAAGDTITSTNIILRS